MLTRFLAIPQMQTPFDTLFEQAQPDTAKIFAAPFLVSDRISKRALLLLLRFQKIIICESAGIFVAQQPQKFRLFLFSKRALTFRRPFPAVLLFWEDGFFVFLEHYPVPQKGHWRKWRLKLKNPNNGSSKLKRTRPEDRSHTGPPAQTEKPICTASPLCEGCPFPGHGILCQGVDGECIEKVVYEFITANVKLIPFRNKICCRHHILERWFHNEWQVHYWKKMPRPTSSGHISWFRCLSNWLQQNRLHPSNAKGIKMMAAMEPNR